MKKRVNRNPKYVPRNSPLKLWRLIRDYPEFPSETESECWYDIIRKFYGNRFRGRDVNSEEILPGKAFLVAKDLWGHALDFVYSLDGQRSAILYNLDRLEKANDVDKRGDLDERVCIQMIELDDRDFIVRDYERMKGRKGYDPRITVKKRRKAQREMNYAPF